MFSQKPAETAAASVAETKAETTEAAGEETKAPEAGEEVTDLKGKMMGVVHRQPTMDLQQNPFSTVRRK